MIEFTGYLTGEAQKHFVKKSNRIGRNIIFYTATLLTPVSVFFTLSTQTMIILYIYLFAMIAALTLTWIPKSKKNLKAITPKRIYTDGESITCVADAYVETRFIQDVKEVHEYETCYDLIFPFGKISEKFVCQKDLLTKGSLQAFENLFEKKITRHM